MYVIDGFRKARPAVAFNLVYWESTEKCLLSRVCVNAIIKYGTILLFVFEL